MKDRIVFTSPFVPPEWIAAHGLQPLRLLPDAGPAADRLQGACPFASDFARTAGRRPLAAGIIVTSTCDQMRRTAERIADVPVFLLNVPATWQTAAARDLYIAELHRLGRFLVGCGGSPPAPTALLGHLRRYDAARRTLRATLPAMTAHTVCLALHNLARTGELQALPPVHPSAPGRVRLALVGGPLRRQDFWLFDLLEDLGADIVLDASQTGERSLPAAFDPQRLETDPLAELACAYFDTIPDAFRRPDSLLYDYLRRRIAERRVQGLVLVRCLWCDQWHAHRERLKESFTLPLVEIDLGDQDHQLQRTRTRLETLVSILQ